MLRAIGKPERAKRGQTRFRGICKDAVSLKVNRVTLYRALVGDRNLPGLLRRYAVLKATASSQSGCSAPKPFTGPEHEESPKSPGEVRQEHAS